MKLNPAGVNAKYEETFIFRNLNNEPYIKIATTKGFKLALNPVWLAATLMKLPRELWNPEAHDKKAISAWIQLVYDIMVPVEDLPDYLS